VRQFYNEFDEAEGFGSFHSSVQGEHGCDSGFSFGIANQVSVVNDSSILASGLAESEAHGPGHGVVHAIASSFFDVTFQVTAERAFTLTGAVSAGGGDSCDARHGNTRRSA
jgi:hypothetical protein